MYEAQAKEIGIAIEHALAARRTLYLLSKDFPEVAPQVFEIDKAIFDMKEVQKCLSTM